MNLPAESERRRWLTWAASGLMVLNLPSLAGCGGGGDDGGPSGGTVGGTPPPAPPPVGTSPASNQSAQATQTALSALTALAGRTPGFDASAAAAELARTGAFARTGVDASSQTAWGRTAAGRWLLVVLDPRRVVGAAPGQSAAASAMPPLARRVPTSRAHGRHVGMPTAPPGRKTALSAGTDLPRLLVSRQMRLLDMLGPIARQGVAHHVAADVGPRTLPDLRAIATARGLQLVPQTPDAAFEFASETTVEGLKAIRGDGVFFVNSFGSTVSDPADPVAALATVSAIATTTRAFVRDSDGSTTAEPAYEADLAAGRLVNLIVPDLRSETPRYRAVLGITPDFCRFYDWQFESNSLAWLNVAGGGIVGGWQGMLGARGAKTLVAWSQGVAMAQMLAVAEDFFHLTLATNAFDGPLAGGLRRSPRLRNYGNGETLEFLANQGLTGSSELAYFPQANPAEYVNVLTPTLDYVLVQERDETCELVGQFGAERDGSLRLARSLNRFDEPLMARATDPTVAFGETLRIETWMGDFVRAELPRDLQGGYLQLFNDGRWTNAVQLTYWEMPFTVRARIDGLLLDVTLRMRLRGDIRGYRLRPDQPPLEQQPGVLLSSMLGSSADWSASGSIERTAGDTTTRIEWSGSGNVTDLGPAFAAAGLVNVSSRIELGARLMRALLLFSAPGLRERTVVTRQGLVQSDTTVEKTAGVGFPLASLDGMPVNLDDRWGITAGLTRDSEPVSLLGPRVREVEVSWPGVAAAFPPEDAVGGR